MSSNDVCSDQDTFNKSVRKAIKYVEKKDKPKGWVYIIMFSLLVLLMFWAILLAMKVSDPNTRVIHFVLALVFSPFYVISYYL